MLHSIVPGWIDICITDRMKYSTVCILLIVAVLQGNVVQASELVKIARMDSKDLVQLYFSFDKAPKFSITENKRRIDLIFTDTVPAADLSLFSPDDRIVKILPRPAKSEFVLSLFFRYKPQKYKLTQSSDGKLVFEVLLGNEFSKSYEELAERLKGLTVLDTIPTDHSNPTILSPYAKNWKSFFANYETAPEIRPQVQFTPPPFPIIGLLPPEKELNMEILDAETLTLANNRLWLQVEEKLLQQLQGTTDVEHQKLLALTLGETLVRKGDFQNAFIQLHLLQDKFNDEWLGTYAGYLLAYLRAVHESPHIADAEFQALEYSIGNSSPLAPYFVLSQMETALATYQYNRLNTLLLRDDVAYPKIIAEIVQIRQADYWYAIKQQVKAYATYQLYRQSTVLPTLPHSMGGYCNTLYIQKKYEEAVGCYEQLSRIVKEKPLLGLISYRKVMAQLKFTDGSSLIGDFARIENSFPGTEAGHRAAMKKNDLLFLQSKDQAGQVIQGYEAIAAHSLSRTIREEALLKTALVHAESGESAKSIALLQQLLRDFQTGDVRISAQALLINLLPGEIKRLVDAKEYIKALVLAKQNRDLFQKNWIDGKFLVDTAEAYRQIGIYDEAQKLYLYLIEIMPVDQREKFYLPMIEATFDHGDYSLVEDYAAQYAYNYPEGKFANEVLFLRIQSLVSDGRLTDALNLLPSPLPEDKELYKIAGSLYFRTNDYENCLNTLNKLSILETPLPQKEQFMLAESLFRTDAFEQAENEFRLVNEENSFYDQSLFRLASLARMKGNEESALSFLRQIVEKGSSPRWKQYAERELQFKTATDRM